MLARSFAAACLLLLPSLAWAKPWNGITPGESTRNDVTDRFGQPTRKVSQGAKEILAYTGEQAISGTAQAQFTVLPTGKVEQIVVFPKRTLELEEIEESFGKACAAADKQPPAPGASCYTKQLTDDFRTYFWYKKVGLVVFFNEDRKTVQSLLYTSPASPGATSVTR